MLKSGETIHNPLTGETFTYLETSAENGGKRFRVLVRVPPSEGVNVPPHVHPLHDQSFRVISGEMTFWLGSDARTIKQGDTVTVPRGTFYNWRVTGVKELVFESVYEPAGHWEAIFETLAAVSHDHVTGKQRVNMVLASAVVQSEYKDHIYFAGLPIALQRLMFRVLGEIGRWMGYKPYVKYSGGDAMPVFDTPITTDDSNLPRVLAQKLPVVLYLYDKPDKALDDALASAAKGCVGEILVVKVNAAENPQTYARYGNPALPALVTLDEGSVESKAARIRPADIEAHVDFLTGQGPMPLSTASEDEARATSGAAPVHTRDATFSSDVLQSAVPVLVDFWAPWCGPCHRVAPALDALAQQYAGRVKIAKLNVDENPQMARQYGAMSIPLLVMFKGGKPVGKLVGAHPQPNIERLIQDALR